MIHSDNQTTFHKAAKVFKASNQRKNEISEDRPKCCRRQIGRPRRKVEVYYRKSQSSRRSVGKSMPTTQGTTEESVG